MKMHKIDNWRWRLLSAAGKELVLFAGPGVAVEQEALDQLELIMAAVEAAGRLDAGAGYVGGAISPDFHPGDPVPIGTSLCTRGFVVPQAIGRDGGCGMLLATLDIDPGKVREAKHRLARRLRHAFFDGGRDIPLTRRQREALFCGGLPALFGVREPGDGRLLSLGRELLVRPWRPQGVREPGSLPGLDDLLGPRSGSSRDGQIGSLGGGNHFAELQVVDRVLSGAHARAFGVRAGQLAIMIHTGSVSIGHLAGGIGVDEARRRWPAQEKHPDIFPLLEGPGFDRYLDISQAAVNFAQCNRFFCAMMAIGALIDEFGAADVNFVHDTPHNFIEQLPDGSWLHRKGSCPARGPASLQEGATVWAGEPVLIPGAMGADSYLLAGQGCDESLQSASHGAGRAISRGRAAQSNREEFAEFLQRYTVVTPLDFDSPEARRRPDIVRDKLAELRQEQCGAYKQITPVIETVTGAGIATAVARLEPFLTVKG